MKIDLKERKQKHQKIKKISLVLSLIFFSFALASALCFIFLSNYKIQLLMSIVGSVVTSLLVIIAIGFAVGGYLPSKRSINLILELENKEEQSLKGKIKLSSKYVTLKKGLSFLVIYVDKQEYYLFDEVFANSIADEQEYVLILRDNMVMEIAHE